MRRAVVSGLAHRLDRTLGEPDRRRGQLGGAARHQLGRGPRLRARRPVVDLLDRLGHRLEVEEDGADVDPGDAVDHRVVGLGEDREAVALEALHQPQLPERLGAVELLREDPRGERPQLVLAAGLGQPRVADVVGEVEVDVVGPERPARLERRLDEPLSEAGHQVEAAAHVLDEVDVERRRPLEDQDRADVHVAGGALVGQERGVDRGQPVEVVSGGAMLQG